MPPDLRRERERRAREDLILDHAHRALVDGGYLGLNLDRLAEVVEYSKGTLYNHFGSKEDLILAVAARNMTERGDLFERALLLEGRPRERAVAIAIADLIHSRRRPGHFQIEQLARTPSLWEKTTEARREELAAAECRCLEAVAQTVREAMKAGDLSAAAGTTDQVAFNIWSMAYGMNLLASTSAWPRKRRTTGLVITPGPVQESFLDGLRWRPLSTDFEYTETERRIRQTIFREELAGVRLR